MRQSGILAAAGLYALDHNVARLADDHANARLIAERRRRSRRVVLDLATVQTNIVIFRLPPTLPDAADDRRRAQGGDVLISALGAAHGARGDPLDVSREHVRARRRGSGGLIGWSASCSRYFCSPLSTSSFFWLCTVTATVTTPVVRCGVSAAIVRLG